MLLIAYEAQPIKQLPTDSLCDWKLGLTKLVTLHQTLKFENKMNGVVEFYEVDTFWCVVHVYNTGLEMISSSSVESISPNHWQRYLLFIAFIVRNVYIVLVLKGPETGLWRIHHLQLRPENIFVENWIKTSGTQNICILLHIVSIYKCCNKWLFFLQE